MARHADETKYQIDFPIETDDIEVVAQNRAEQRRPQRPTRRQTTRPTRPVNPAANDRTRVFLACGVIMAVLAAASIVMIARDDAESAAARPPQQAQSPATQTPQDKTTTSDASPAPTAAGITDSNSATGVWVDAQSFGMPYSNAVDGVITFRGNPTRSYYGSSSVPDDPSILWRYPRNASMCGMSAEGGESRQWCGMGWTGQSAVWKPSWDQQGRTWAAFGAYDKAVHFIDANTGEPILQPFATGDIIKGSVTVDPDGFPLLYSGSRDNYMRVLALDGNGTARELWKLSANAVSPTLWNNDWDGSPLILDDFMFIGGENSQFHIAKLNRGYDANGKVTVNPKLVFNTPGWDAELLASIPDRQVSIENSVAISGDTVYFANSGGLVQGWDIAPIRTGVGKPTRVFRFWTGDDTDASIVVDESGFLYVASQSERKNQRSRDVGQIIKLDPRNATNPIVWSVDDYGSGKSGVWATPAVYRDIVVVGTNGGRLLGIDRTTGTIRWTKKIGGPLWSSPIIADNTLLQGDSAGNLHAYDVTDTTVEPRELWSVATGGNIESTPTVYDGKIYVGSRVGAFFAIGDRQ